MTTLANPSPGPKKNLLFLYETWQVRALLDDTADGRLSLESTTIISFSTEIDALLRLDGIAYVTVGDYFDDAPKQLIEEDELLQSYFADPRWCTTAYGDVVLVETFRTAFRLYMQTALYYIRAMTAVLGERHQVSCVLVYASAKQPSSLAGILAHKETTVVEDCASLIAHTRGIECRVLREVPATAAVIRHFRNVLFYARRALFARAIWLWNLCINFIGNPAGPRLLLTDYWRNVSGVIEHLPRASCLFLDRSEIRSIPFGVLFRHRMRFVKLDAGRGGARRTLRMEAREIATHMRAYEIDESDLITGGVNIAPLLHGARDAVLDRLDRILTMIRGAHELCDRESIDVVLLRASVSAQLHFSILALVARSRRIPSLELQHGLEYLGPGSMSREHTAEYIATYGSLSTRELVSVGMDEEHAVPIGSPRFDAYARATKSVGKAPPEHVLCIAPDVRAYALYDSYAAERYFSGIRDGIEGTKDIMITIKIRAGYEDEHMLRGIIERTFAHRPFRIAQHESLESLCASADLAISCYSTAVLELMQMGIPVLLYANSKIDAAIMAQHFGQYEAADALTVCTSPDDVRQAFSALCRTPDLEKRKQNAAAFLESQFLFDGRGAERCAKLIQRLAHRTP